jgi:hypothetical protein
MDDITTSRIEPMAENTGADQYAPRKETPRKRETPENRPPSPSIESDEIVEEIHKIDELA